MWDFFIRRRPFAYLVLIVLLAVGTYSIYAIPKESAPEVVIPVGIVTTVLPGAPALDVEKLVTEEIESNLTNLENVANITSISREGVSSITVEFEAEANLESSILDLKDEVEAAQPELPETAQDSVVTEVDFVDQPILTLSIAADISDESFTTLAASLEDELEDVAGVSRVEAQGVRDRQVTVLVEQTALERFEISLGDVTSAIQAANSSFPIGQITTDGISYNIAFEGDITSTSQIADVSVATKGGQPIYVKDVAVVEDALAQANTISRLSVEGDPSKSAITLNVYKNSNADVTRVAADVNERIDELKATDELLEGLTSTVLLDSGELVQDDLIRLSTSGLQTVVLVVLLLIFAIGWREGLLAGLAIPLSFMIGFIGLYFSGNTINFLSLFALILGVGILVDSAIVMVEGINRRMKEDETVDKEQAAIDTVHEFSAPLIAGTLTTVSMFVGLFIVSGVTGQFIASIPFTLIFLLFASLFVALAVIPLFASSFLKRRSATTLEKRQYEYAIRLENWYKAQLREYLTNPRKQFLYLTSLASALVGAVLLTVNVFAALLAVPSVFTFAVLLRNIQERRNLKDWTRKLFWYPGVVGIIAASVLVAGSIFPTLPLVKVVFFEQGDGEFIIVEIESSEGTVKETTDIYARRVEDILYSTNDIASFVTTVGSGNQFGGGGSGEKLANMFVNLEEDREQTSAEIIEQLRAEFAVIDDFTVTVNQPADGPPTGAAIIVKFLGEDLEEITDLANQATLIAERLDGAVNIERSTNSNTTEYVIDLDREKAASFGLNALTVSQTLRTAIFGTEATTVTIGEEDIDVIVQLNTNQGPDISSDLANVTTINEIEQLTIPSATGPVSIGTIASIDLRESNSVITREDGDRVVTVTADVQEGANAREVQSALLDQINNELDIPTGITVSTGGGETEESNAAFIELFLALIVGVLLMIAVLVLQFNSYLYTRYVLAILPYSLIGIMTGLAVTRSPLSFPSIMGFIALSGIVVNNAILLIDIMNQNRRKTSDSLLDVILNSSASRLRPILLTSTTTIIGMTPLIFAGDLWAPLAYAVMFGLIFSVFITLVLIPIIYYRNPGNVK